MVPVDALAAFADGGGSLATKQGANIATVLPTGQP